MPDDKLEKLHAQRKVINSRIRQEQSRRNKRTRKEDTRRKILAGAWLLDEIEQREDFRKFVYKKLDSFLTRPNDRALFNLPPRSSPAPASPPVEGNNENGTR